MKKTHKRLLGVGGLALVAAITTVAYHIPDAGAVSYSAEVDVNVNVISTNPEAQISSPLDGAKITSANLHIVARYADADAVAYTLSNGVTTIDIPSPALSGNADAIHGNSGEHDFYYNLKEFDPSTAGYGDYTLKMTVTRNGSSVEDTVGFSYVPAAIDGGSIPTDANNNPIISLSVKSSVVKVEAIALKPDGEEALRTTVDTNGQTTVEVTLPFSDNDSLESDTYTVKFITYSYNGLGQLVADQDEATTDLITTVSYTKKPAPIIPPDDTPTTPQNPAAGDANNPSVIVPSGVTEGETVHVVVVDSTTGKTVLETDLPANSDGTVTVPFGDYNLPEGNYGVYVTPYVTDPITGDKVLNPAKTVYSNVNYDGKTVENQPTYNPANGNPIIPITNDGSVEKAKIVITDKDGYSETIIVDINKDQKSIEVPFDKLGLPSGNYSVKVITYSINPNTNKLAPNQNPTYVRPYDISYEGKTLPYRFVDEDNELETHDWDRYADAGKNLRFRIPTADTYRYFDRNEVYLTTAANEANLFNSAYRLNTIYFEDFNGSLILDLLSGYLATLPNGSYILGTKLTNGQNPTVEFDITGKINDCTSNPDPSIKVDVDEGVVKLEVIVYDKNDKELFRFIAPVTSATANYITIPMSNYCLEDGEYSYKFIPYGKDGKPMIPEEDATKIKFTYGNVIEVPNTGGFLSSLNLSQKDFLLTGLIIFGVVTAGGVLILRKKELRR